MIGAVEEEGSSRGAYHLLASGRPAPDHLIALEPSGWDALTLGYKGSLHAGYLLRQAMAHGSAPSGSAVDQAIAFVRSLQDHAEMISVGKSSFDRLDVRVIELDGRPGDGLQESARMRIGLRLPEQLVVTELKAWLQDHAAGAQLEFDSGIAAYRADKNTPLVRAFLSAPKADEGHDAGSGGESVPLPALEPPVQEVLGHDVAHGGEQRSAHARMLALQRIQQ